MYKDVPLEASVKRHLVKVYSVLFTTLVFASAGAATHVVYHVGGLLTSLLSIVTMIAVSVIKTDVSVRIAIMSLSGFLTGCSFGPLVERAIEVDPSIIVTAFLSTAVIFCCFTMAAITADKRLRLYLGGLLSSAFSVIMVLSVMRMFFGSYTIIQSLYLYLGLLMFSGYVIFDTQMIIHKKSTGISDDYVWHAMELFTDFVAIFVRIVAILLKNAESEKKRRKK